MIFTRRSIQTHLDDLKNFVSHRAVEELAARLNIPGKDRLAAMWEVVILSAFARHGAIDYEKALDSGKKPDVQFRGRDGLDFIADVTCISDEGLDKDNPIDFLYKNILLTAKRLNLPPGGINLQVKGAQKESSRGVRTTLKLPKHGEIPRFVKQVIEVEFKRQLKQGNKKLHLQIDDEEASILLSIEIGTTRFNSVGHPSYDIPFIIDRNPLYSALSSKAKKQLKSAKGNVGIIVCDGDCKTISSTLRRERNDVAAICLEFFRQYRSVDFILIFSVSEQSDGLSLNSANKKKIATVQLMARPGFAKIKNVKDLLAKILPEFPVPINTPVNAAYLAKQEGFGSGHRGGFTVSRNKVKISSRVIMELLSGRKSIEEFNGDYEWDGKVQESKVLSMINPFESKIREGRLPIKISVEKSLDDDWLEFEFGEPDAAVLDFKS